MPKQKKQKQFWTDFKTFISRGNVVDLAVAMVVGAAFNKIVSQLVDSFINPLIGMFVGGFDLADLKYVVHPAEVDKLGNITKAEVAFTYGMFLQAVIDFLIISLTVFIVVKLYTRLKKHLEEESKKWYDELNPEEAKARRKKEAEEKAKAEEAKKAEEARLKEIEQLKREKEEAQRLYFQTQQELLTEIRDALQTK
ncbi:MAG: large conductance mechanosensitive channel protein MscL [Clostridia bacterium]|nr:large conductance mechanosensitive channel protein MscL [Clostridia bacterium]